jgi:hypothetical protein
VRLFTLQSKQQFLKLTMETSNLFKVYKCEVLEVGLRQKLADTRQSINGVITEGRGDQAIWDRG